MLQHATCRMLTIKVAHLSPYIFLLSLLWIQCHICASTVAETSYHRYGQYMPIIKCHAPHHIPSISDHIPSISEPKLCQKIFEWVICFWYFALSQHFALSDHPKENHLFLIFCRSAIRSAIVVLSSPPVVGAKYVPISQAETSDAANS